LSIGGYRSPARPSNRYFAGERSDLLTWLGGSHERVLEIGCGAGGNAEWLRQRGAKRLVGIDIDEASVRAAADAFDSAILGSVEAVLPALTEVFDLVICADVLEHLMDPRAVLGELADHLDSHGTIVASIPNVRHFRSLARIALGRGFAPETEGVFDATHLHFFTRDNIAEMIRGAGLEPVRWGSSPSRRLRRLRAAISRGPAAEYLTYQWFVTARLPGGRTYP
jgi:2-polyprenyl-3-methyl-5-hydroxy-6-metoxy-1,4-benzoquinol methylase